MIKHKLTLVVLSWVVSLGLVACGGAIPEPATVQEEVIVTEENYSQTDVAEVVIEERSTAEVIIEEETATAEEVTTAKAGATEEIIEPQTAAEQETITEEDTAMIADVVEEETVVETAAADKTAAEEAAADETAEIEPETVAVVDWLTKEGRTEEGFAFLGNPEAPITIMDYSDFM